MSIKQLEMKLLSIKYMGSVYYEISHKHKGKMQMLITTQLGAVERVKIGQRGAEPHSNIQYGYTYRQALMRIMCLPRKKYKVI